MQLCDVCGNDFDYPNLGEDRYCLITEVALKKGSGLVGDTIYEEYRCICSKCTDAISDAIWKRVKLPKAED